MAMTHTAFDTITDAGADAPWLCMVHGMAQDMRTFDAQVAAFRGQFQLLLVDLPGHGRSADVPGPFGLEEFTAGVLDAMQRAGVGRTIWWGTHTGAGVGLLLACRGLVELTALVLEGPVLPGAPPPSVLAMLGRVGEIARADGPAAARDYWWANSPWFDVMRAHPQRTRAAGQRALLDAFPCAPWLDARPPAPVTPFMHQLGQIQAPVCIINGQDDVPDFLPVAEELAGLLPNAQTHRIPGAGGFPLWEAPDAVNELVAGFIKTNHG